MSEVAGKDIGNCKINTRRGRDENAHHERNPENLNIKLGISNEARASAQACASHSARHTYHQRARDFGVAISLRQARHINLEPNEEGMTRKSYHDTTEMRPDRRLIRTVHVRPQIRSFGESQIGVHITG